MELKDKTELEFEQLLKSYPEIEKYNVKPEFGALYDLKKNKNDKKEIIPFKLILKESISQDVKIFTFEIPDENILGLSAGNHVSINFTRKIFNLDLNQVLEEEVCRKYTPISPIMRKGSFQILVKIYNKNADPKYPEGGVLTQWLDQQEIGSFINFRGPLGKFNYFGNGYFRLGFKPKPLRFVTKQFDKVGMIAGGTGIAPIFHILQEAFLNDENLEFHLVYSNRQEDDILLKDTIRYMSKKSRSFNESEKEYFEAEFAREKNEDRKILDFIFKNGETHKKTNFYLKFSNILTRVNDTHPSYYNGKLTEDIIKILLPPPDDKTLVMLCGRGKMCKKFLTPILLGLGHHADNIFTF